MPSETGDLINFSGSPPRSPITTRSTSSALAAKVLAQGGWLALKPDQPSSDKWGTGSWTRIERPVGENMVEDQNKSKGSEKVTEQVVASPSSTIDREKAPISLSGGSEETQSFTSINFPSTIHHHEKEDPQYTPTSIAGKNIPLPDSPHTSLHHHDNDEPKHTPNSAARKNIPLPESPYTPHKNDSDNRSITSDEAAQSRLSATAKPFTATPTSAKRIEIVRTSEPPSFFPSPPSAGANADAEADETVLQTPDVSADQMDPSYFAPGYGGHLTASSTSHSEGGLKSPVRFAPPQSRALSITIPEPKVKVKPEVKVEKEENRPSTPVTVKTYDGTADSPISDRVMREHTPKSPSEASSDLPQVEHVSYYEGEDQDPRPLGLVNTDRIPGLEQLTAHFGSISLTPADEPISVPPHGHPDHPSSEGTSAGKSISPNPYEGTDGRLSPHLTGAQGDCDEPISVLPHDHPPSKGASAGESITPNPYEAEDGRLSPQLTGQRGEHDDLTEQADSSDNLGQDTTLVSDGQFDDEGSAAEINDLEGAWKRFGEGYGQFSGSMEEALVRLRVELAYTNERLSASLPNGADASSSPEVRALRSQLQATRKKYQALFDELESIKRENEDLDRSNTMLAAAARLSAINLRVTEEQKLDFQKKFEHGDNRNQELIGKYLRLQEDYEVLDARSRSDPRDHFVVVLLEGEGRLFDVGLIARGFDGGRIMATKLIESIGDLCKEVLDSDLTPKINIQLFTDVQETVEELQKVNRISDEVTFQEFLSGFQLENKLVSVNLVEGQYGPGEAISKYAKFYATIPQCQMVVVGAGWNKPYRGLMEIKSRVFVDKFYALRSTPRIDRDPFVDLGNQKLLYVKHIFTTSVTEWKDLMKGKGGNGGGGGGGYPDGHSGGGGGGGRGGSGHSSSGGGGRGDDGNGNGHDRGGGGGSGGGGGGGERGRFTSASSYGESSVSTTRAASPPAQPKRQRSPSPAANPRAQQIETGRSNRLVSPDSSPTSRVPASQAPWATGYAPRARQVNTVSRQGGGGGSLLDQMLEAQSVSSRADSPDSDGTVGPGHHGMVIAINSSEGSVGGSPPSSDSDRPSVAVPHSARKHVRRPVNYASADQDEDNVSEYSSVSAATTSSMTSFTAPASRSAFRPSPIRVVPTSRPVRPMAAVPRGVPVGNNSNTIPLGTRTASGSTRPSEASTSTIGGLRVQGSQVDASPAAQRLRELSIRGTASRS